jgi:hypothetical protein
MTDSVLLGLGNGLLWFAQGFCLGAGFWSANVMVKRCGWAHETDDHVSEESRS